MKELLEWIRKLNDTTLVKITKTSLNENSFWYFNKSEGAIMNRDNSFFSIKGLQGYIDNKFIEQPIIIQDEIGYLGIICKKTEKTTKYLMQAKIEPGNINCVQISPTIQATKSNFLQRHGGKKPLYLEYFLNADKHRIVADQIQSEQSSRFYKKRNRNMIIEVDEEEDVPIYNDRFKWMTLSEIKGLMKYKNLVNMDTRTVLSCLPICDKHINEYGEVFKNLDTPITNSLTDDRYVNEIISIYHKINNYKMFATTNTRIVGLNDLENWTIDNNGIRCTKEYPYEVMYCDIQIEGREVTRWVQPLFKANGIALFGLIRTIINAEYKFLVKITPEIGSFDKIEIGPTIQKEYGEKYNDDVIEVYFENKIHSDNDCIIFDSILSEEGGRFYHEENRNLIIEVEYNEIPELPPYYHFLSLNALSHFTLFNNCLNIQLRNLISVMEVN